MGGTHAPLWHVYPVTQSPAAAHGWPCPPSPQRPAVHAPERHSVPSTQGDPALLAAPGVQTPDEHCPETQSAAAEHGESAPPWAQTPETHIPERHVSGAMQLVPAPSSPPGSPDPSVTP